MKRLSSAAVISAALLSFLLTTVMATPNAPTPATPTMSTSEANQLVNQAIQDLDAALEKMDKAPDIYGGHKVTAITDAKKAVTELNKALEFQTKQTKKTDKK